MEKILLNNIYNMDCLKLIKKLKKNNFKVNLILTDPPYNISRKNNFKTIGRAGIDFGDWDKNFDQLKWLKNITDIIEPGGSIIIFNDWKNMGDISKELEKQGLEIKDLIRWVKPAPMPRNTKRRYVTDFEFAIWATKPGEKWTFNKPEDKPYLRPEYRASPTNGKNRIHPTQKAENLIEEIIKTHTNEGDVVFDPFSGSGQISYSANLLNRFYIGSEIDKKYYEQSIKRIKSMYFRAPFNHLGNKYRMIEELMREFPKKNIDCFVDAFAGTGLVGLNYKTPKKIYLNDNDIWLSRILEHLFNTEKKILLNSIEEIIKKFNLPREKKKYDVQYNKLRDDFNRTKEIPKLLVLILFGFNQQIRFNNKEEFNIPVGKFWWNEYHKSKIINFINNTKDKKIAIKSQDFKIFIDETLPLLEKEKTIFYFDPPYLLSNATYNNVWNEEKEKELIACLEYLTNQGYYWFLSNVIESKNKVNIYLSNFIEKNKDKIKIINIDNIDYKNSNYQRKNDKNKKDKEILVSNFFYD